MSKVAIITDTISQMTKELADEFNIRLAPMYITLDGKSCPENELDLAWFYKQIPRWKEAGKMPTTSSVSPGDFLKAYRELSQKAEAVLCITYSSKFGMAYNSAIQAKKMAEEELPQATIEVIDSYTVCGGQMLIVIEAARAAAAGKSLPEVIEVVNNLMKKVNYVHLSDDLSLLAKGGRIHRARPWASSQITNTVLLEAEQLRELTLSRFPCAEVFITPVYPLVAIHTGLRSFNFSWWGEGEVA